MTLTEAGVLCLLSAEGERSGYELLKAAAKSVGHVWSPAKSQLYAVLPRLAKDGLVRSQAVVQADRPDKRLYRITRDGRGALDVWLTTVEPENVDAFRLRVFYGALMTREVLIAHVEAYRRYLRDRLAVFNEIHEENSGRGHDWYHRLMLDYGYASTRAALGWADDTLSKLRRRR